MPCSAKGAGLDWRPPAGARRRARAAPSECHRGARILPDRGGQARDRHDPNRHGGNPRPRPGGPREQPTRVASAIWGHQGAAGEGPRRDSAARALRPGMRAAPVRAGARCRPLPRREPGRAAHPPAPRLRLSGGGARTAGRGGRRETAPPPPRAARHRSRISRCRRRRSARRPGARGAAGPDRRRPRAGPCPSPRRPAPGPASGSPPGPRRPRRCPRGPRASRA